MKKLKTIPTLILLVTTTFFCSLQARSKKQKKQNHQESLIQPQKNFLIRVLLEEKNAQEQQKIVLAADKGFILRSPLEQVSKKAHLLHKKLHLIIKNKKMYVRCKDGIYRRIKYDSLSISPIKDILHYNEKSYHGTLVLRIDEKNNKFMLINHLSLDDYIYSVLRFEGLSYWPHEMQKVQAIISRTYALYHMDQMKNKQENCFYDIKNTNSHQVYNGFHSCTHLKQAVCDTHNLVLTYQGKIALTEFDICCGGIIPAFMKYKDSDKPYLYRKNQCHFCQGKTHYEWKKSIHKEEFIGFLKNHPKVALKIEKLGKFQDIIIKEKDKAGILHKIILHGSKKRITLTAYELKSSLSTFIKSLAITVTKIKNRVEIKGKGFGHQRGLCQLGARELVARGKKYDEILSYYYPKTKLTQVK